MEVFAGELGTLVVEETFLCGRRASVVGFVEYDDMPMESQRGTSPTGGRGRRRGPWMSWEYWYGLVPKKTTLASDDLAIMVLSRTCCWWWWWW